MFEHLSNNNEVAMFRAGGKPYMMDMKTHKSWLEIYDTVLPDVFVSSLIFRYLPWSTHLWPETHKTNNHETQALKIGLSSEGFKEYYQAPADPDVLDIYSEKQMNKLAKEHKMVTSDCNLSTFDRCNLSTFVKKKMPFSLIRRVSNHVELPTVMNFSNGHSFQRLHPSVHVYSRTRYWPNFLRLGVVTAKICCRSMAKHPDSTGSITG
jgi:hypothetical protein